jgi:beta-lactamase regulating signal transducer with metallopeptidase domain/protein involved in polysaccharide export with SLBB domain
MNAWLLAGWTMLHFFWVGALVAAAGAIVRLAVRRCGPNVRYASSLAMLAAVACAPVVIACVLARNPAWIASAWEAPSLPVDVAQQEATTVNAPASQRVPRQSRGLSGDEAAETYVELKGQPEGDLAWSDSRRESATVGVSLRETHDAADVVAVMQGDETPGLRRGLGSELMQRVVGALPIVWLIGAPVTFLLLAAGLVGSRRLTRSGLLLVEGRVAEACARLRSALRVSRRVAVAAVEGLAQPVLVGIVKPTILLPAAALNGWTVEELEMVLVHELAHVRRWDNLVNLGQRVIEAALFFHPCVWLASRQVRRDREECCDWVVVQHTQAPEAYAELLVSVASQLRSEPGRPRPGSGSGTSRLAGAVMALAGASPMAQHALVGRVRRILKLEDDPMWISRRMMGMLVMLSLVSSVAVYRAFAVPAPVLNADADAFAEVGVKSDRARPEAAADDASKVVNYFMADIEAVDPIAWLRITATDGVNVRWFEENKSVVINASQEVHEKIADLLEASRRAPVARRSAPTWNVTMLQLQQQLQQIERDLADAEVMKQVAIQQSQSPVALDEAVAADLDRDPQMEIYKAQISALNDQIQNLNDPAASAAGADHGTATRALLREIGRIQRACDDYRKTAAATIRERLSKVSNEAVRAAMAAYNVRVEHLTKKKQALEKQLTALEAKVNALTTEEVEERGDRPATVERAFPFDPVLFECANILGEAPELSLHWNRSDDSLVIVAPQRVLDGLTMCADAAKGKKTSSGDSMKEFGELFAAGHDNPPVTVEYSFTAFDEMAGSYGAAIDLFEGYVRDPYGPQLPISWRELGGGQVEVTMPRAGHAWLRLMTTQESPLMRTAARKKADDDGERAEDAAGNPLAVDESGSTQRESELLVNADGSALLDAEAVTKEELGPRLGSRGYMPRIRLRAVAGLPYKQVVAWMDALREAGVRDIGVDVRTGTAEAENQPDGSGDPYATTDITSFPVAEDGAIEFPADANPALVKQTIENLTKAGWKIDIRNGTWYIRRREAEAAAETKSALAARTPYRIGPGDTLLVRTLGAAPDWPVDGQFMVEDEGTIALGPAYGRVEVAGLTVREAEAAVLKVLKETLSDPKVQVTIVGKARGARREARAEDEPLAIVESPGPAIESGDLLWIEVEGTLPDQPIKGPFTVSRDGELHFGPSYGVVEVAGLNSVDAEMRIRQKLSEVLTECRVLVRVLKKSNGASGEARRWTHGVALPEDMGDAEAQWVAEAIERQGIGAKAFENGGKLVLEIATPTPLPPFKVVWEAHQVGDRMQRMCRLIGEDGRDMLPSPFGKPSLDPYAPDPGATPVPATTPDGVVVGPLVAVADHFPNGVTEEAAEKIVAELRQQGIQAEIRKAGEDELLLLIRTTSPRARIVWKKFYGPSGDRWIAVVEMSMGAPDPGASDGTSPPAVTLPAVVYPSTGTSTWTPVGPPGSPPVGSAAAPLAGPSRFDDDSQFVELLPGMTEDDLKRLAGEMKGLGFSVMAFRRDDGQLLLKFVGLGVKAKPVWETQTRHDAEGKPQMRKTLRLVGPDGKAIDPITFYLTPPGDGGDDSALIYVADSAAPTPTPLYDGKTFEWWRDQWRSELKVEKRTEAVEALAAFARAGYGREAAEALLDVAGEYDFTVMDDLPEGKLKQRVVKLLTMHLPKSIQTSDWFPVLVERFKADPDKWRSVMRGVLGSVYDADEAMQTKIRELMDNPEYDVALPAWQALVGSAGNSGDQEERVRLLREGLASENTEIRKLALSWTGFATEQLEKIPEPFEMLFSDDAEIALEARQQLAMTPEKYRAALAERLWAVVDDPERDASHVAALRGICVLYGTSMASHAQDSQSDRAWRTDTAQRLIKHLQDGPREEWAAAAWALDDEWDADASKFKGWIRTGNISEERLEEVLALKQDISKEREAAMGPPNRR